MIRPLNAILDDLKAEKPIAEIDLLYATTALNHLVGMGLKLAKASATDHGPGSTADQAYQQYLKYVQNILLADPEEAEPPKVESIGIF